MENSDDSEIYDLFIIGGGVNGCGIARDAAGRGHSVFLAEMGDLAQATSSASTKMFHGGLRYLEYYEFRLVREALHERETLLRAMPHISWPMRFVLPYTKGQRPAWLIRLGLFIYDHLGGRKILPGTRTLDLRKDPVGKALKDGFTKAFEYSDCWVQDARLVVLNARDAAERGASINPRTKVVAARRVGDLWEVETEDMTSGDCAVTKARVLVNAAGPWVGKVVQDTIHSPSTEGVRLVRGSHIVVPKLLDDPRACFFQNNDGRIGFVIPFEQEFSLIGTTEAAHEGDPAEAVCTDEEADYLCAFVSEYTKKPVTRADIVWTYSGVRPLYDDGASSATEATRDYVLSLDTKGPAPLLNIFGGKITTYRRLAEAALARLEEYLGKEENWTAGVPLAGGDFPVDGVAELQSRIAAAYPFLSAGAVLRLLRTYGTEVFDVYGEARAFADLGQDFGGGLFEAEVRWLLEKEFAYDAVDIVWRRTKCGLRMEAAQVDALQAWLEENR